MTSTITITTDDPLGDVICHLARYHRMIAAEFKHLGDRMSALDDAIADLTTKIAALTAVDESAAVLIGGIGGQITAAVDKALAAGATPEQLAAMTDLSAKLESETTSMAAAVAAGTPAAPTPEPEPAPTP